MIELDEELFPLARAAAHFPGPAPKPHAATVTRWALKGVGSPRVRLESVKIGGRRYTSRAALHRFIARLSGAEAERHLLAQSRAEALSQAERELDADGID